MFVSLQFEHIFYLCRRFFQCCFKNRLIFLSSVSELVHLKLLPLSDVNKLQMNVKGSRLQEERTSAPLFKRYDSLWASGEDEERDEEESDPEKLSGTTPLHTIQRVNAEEQTTKTVRLDLLLGSKVRGQPLRAEG